MAPEVPPLSSPVLWPMFWAAAEISARRGRSRRRFFNRAFIEGLLGGSWVVISGVTSKATIVTTHIRGFVTRIVSTHEPPSRDYISGSSLHENPNRKPRL